MKTKDKKALIIAGSAAALVLIWLLFFRKKEEKIVLVTENPVYGHIAARVTATGTIQPVDTTSVGTRASGTIEAVYADFNSRVKKGQLLAVLDKSLLQASADQFRASLTEAQANLSYQESSFNRQKQLFATGSVSRADYELALNNYRSASAVVKNIQAQLRSAERNVSFTNIYSPVDGVVLSRSVSAGQTVAASFSTPTLFVIAKDITKMQVQAAVDEADIGNVQSGQRVSFTVDAYIEDLFKGTVAEIRLKPKVTSNVVTYTTLIDASNEGLKLKPGMTANIAIYTKEADHALLISSKALNFSPDSALEKQFEIKPLASKPQTGRQTAGSDGKKTSVWVKKGDLLIETAVKVGIDDNTHAQIIQGLIPADDVVTSLPVPGEKANSKSIIPPPPKR